MRIVLRVEVVRCCWLSFRSGGRPQPHPKAVPRLRSVHANCPANPQGYTSGGVAPALAYMRGKGGGPPRGCRPPWWAYSATPHDAGRAQSPHGARLLSFVGGVVGALCRWHSGRSAYALACRRSVPASPVAPCGRLTRQKKIPRLLRLSQRQRTASCEML